MIIFPAEQHHVRSVLLILEPEKMRRWRYTDSVYKRGCCDVDDDEMKRRWRSRRPFIRVLLEFSVLFQISWDVRVLNKIGRRRQLELQELDWTRNYLDLRDVLTFRWFPSVQRHTKCSGGKRVQKYHWMKTHERTRNESIDFQKEEQDEIPLCLPKRSTGWFLILYVHFVHLFGSFVNTLGYLSFGHDISKYQIMQK